MAVLVWSRGFFASDLWDEKISPLLIMAVIVGALGDLNALPILVTLVSLFYFTIVPDHLRAFWHRVGAGYGVQGGLSSLAVIVLGCASSFFLVSIPFFSSLHIVERGDGRVEYHGRLAVTTVVPLRDTVRGYDEDQSTKKTCAGVTSDGHHILADVFATLRVTPESLPKVHARSLDRFSLKEAVSSELCNRFSSVISGYAVERISSQVVIGAWMLKERNGMEDLGVSYAGEVSIKNIRAYAAM